MNSFGYKLALTLVILAYNSNLFGQQNEQWFGKGTSVIDLLQRVNYSSLTNSENNIKYNNFEVNLRANYFVADNFGVVAGVHVDNSVSKSTVNDSESKNNYSLFEVGGIYGFQPEFLNEIPISAQLTFGFGGSDIFSFETGLFATQVSISSYHPVGPSGLHISPNLGYGFLNQPFKESDGSAFTNGFFAGFSLIKPFSCEEYLCALDAEEAPNSLYESGTNIINFTQIGLFSTGLTQIRDSDFNVNNTNLELRLSDYHYFFNNFAVGAALDLDLTTANQKDFESKTNTTNFTLMPMARYHVPIQGLLNHLYADAGFGFGSSNSNSIFSGNESKTKNGVTSFELGLGYNVPFTERLAFSIQGGYAQTTLKDKDTDIKDKRGGFAIKYGLSYKLIP